MIASARDFPPAFHFGAATSAYQVEGGVETDWTEWERRGKTHTLCGTAVDHWNRFEGDFGLLAGAGLSVYRMSIEWARVEPEPGVFDDRALERYRRMLELLQTLGVRTMVTLHHFTHPRWFHERNPWTGPRSVQAFANFARVVGRALRGRVGWYVTINEPMVLLLGGYVDAQMPPGLKDLEAFRFAAGNLLRAHVAAREVLAEVDPGIPVGLAHNCMAFGPLRRMSPVDRVLAGRAAELYNHAVPRALVTGELELRMPLLLRHREKIDGARRSLDFLGVNYYTRIHVGASLSRRGMRIGYRDRTGRGLTDVGWELYPEGFKAVLGEMSRYGVPLWVTENGVADASGERRVPFLREHLRALRDAMRAGADVRGYLYWSLLDNFEWLEGLGPRFGLYRVDFQSLERHATDAVPWLRQVAATGVIG